MFSGSGLGRWLKGRNSAKAAGLAGGLLFGLSVAIFGFWKALVITVFASFGFILGVLVDGSAEIKGALLRIFGLSGAEDGEDE